MAHQGLYVKLILHFPFVAYLLPYKYPFHRTRGALVVYKLMLFVIPATMRPKKRGKPNGIRSSVRERRRDVSIKKLYARQVGVTGC
jgi:hypothetical protein